MLPEKEEAPKKKEEKHADKEGEVENEVVVAEPEVE